MRRNLLGLLLLACAGIIAAVSFPEPAMDVKAPAGKQTAVFAGGCFWCTEVVFEKLAGVENVVSGYSGGSKNDAHYNKVSAGKTDHAEAIRIVFDSSKISYGRLLQVFFSVAHDPTQLNRQGPDWGRQYRSAIFYANDEQKRVAEAYLKQLGEAKVYGQPIVTQIVPLDGFYDAETYHQNFVQRNPAHPYVVANALPKLKKLKQTFPQLVRK
jgi:peptide-methionine (S)-S-oxide reductase